MGNLWCDRAVVVTVANHLRESLAVAGALIADAEGRVLLLHRNLPGMTWWEVPGGKIEPGEEAWHAAARELREELDVDVEFVAEVATDQFDSRGTWLEYTWFIVRLVGGAPRPTEASFDNAKFFSMNEVEEMTDLSPSAQHVFECHHRRVLDSLPCPR